MKTGAMAQPFYGGPGGPPPFPWLLAEILCLPGSEHASLPGIIGILEGASCHATFMRPGYGGGMGGPQAGQHVL